MKKFLLFLSLLVIGIGLVSALGFFGKHNTASLIGSIDHVINQQPNPATSDEELKKEIGQMILLGFRGTDAKEDSEIAQTIKDLQIGGVILFDYDAPSKSFPRNITSPEQTKQLISTLQSYSSTPLFVSIDAEGGQVLRLQSKYGFLPIMSAQDMGKKGVATVASESAKLGAELKDLGFNMNFAPVVDVNVNPSNPVIGKLGRSFSADPAKVSQDAVAFIQEQNKAGIITVEKHFPGHGSSTTDSHMGLVDITNTYQDIELNPYKDLQKAGLLDVVMSAHVTNKSIDAEFPASLSPNFLQHILRQEVGFNGVVVSDDMQMGAIVKNFGFTQALIQAINAGNDILLLSNNGTEPYDPQLAQKAVDAIFMAVKNEKLTVQQIHDSYLRIMDLKKKYGVVPSEN